MASDARGYAEEQGLPATLTAAMKTVLLEKPTDGKARLVELLADGPQVFKGGKGGIELDKSKTAILFIEFQNEFATEGGKLHDAVKPVMESTGMLAKAADVADACRTAGVKVMHTGIMFKDDATDNPNKGLGILAGCANDKLFTEGTWNSAFCDSMKPKEGDIIVTGKKGLDTFPHSDLEAQLKANGIETLAICGFLTNCCVESTMRTAYEKGFNTITVTDCCATTGEEGQLVTKGSFGMFSTPLTADEFKAKLA